MLARLKNVGKMEEIWKPIPIDGFSERYEVSNNGRIRSVQRKIISSNRWGAAPRSYDCHLMKTKIARGYHTIGLRKFRTRKGRTFFVHRLVAMAFIPNPNNLPCVDHIDTNRDNNNVENLRWCTHRENSLNPITRQHLTAVMMGNQRSKGIIRSEEYKRKMSKIKKGHRLSAESIEKIRSKLIGRKQTEERRLKTCKPIGQYSIDGKLIKIWPSGTDAARELGLGWSNILSCANPNKIKRKTAGGYIWKYV